MRFNTSDPDIATIVRRIERHVMDLQPNFQRGEVWSTAKKQRLIDSILRHWHVPPIHLVSRGGGKFDVLDGQQRLTAIRDFVRGVFPVDGTIAPLDDSVRQLHDLRYQQLPDDVRDEFDAFSIRVFALQDFTPEEPHELFFRLNQPTSLTEAEKRNAFIGGPRNQVKELVDWAVDRGMRKERLGFSNARMSYDDLLARFLLTLESGTLEEKVTALRITNRYRAQQPFSDAVMSLAEAALEFFLRLPILDNEGEVRPNKATIHTWLCMAAKLEKEDLQDSVGHALAETVQWIEGSRLSRQVTPSSSPGESAALLVFHDRSTARVADVSSVVLRDLTAWMILARRSRNLVWESDSHLAWAASAWQLLDGEADVERTLSSFAGAMGWGGKGWL